MTIDLERWVKFLCKAKLTPNQYAFLAIMHEKKYKLIYMMKELNSNILTLDELTDLIDRDLLNNWNDTNNYQLDQFELSDKAKTLFNAKCE